MNGLLSVLTKDSIKVAQLERIYSAYGASAGFAGDAISAMRQLDAEVAWRAIWLLKRLAVDHRLDDADLFRLAQCAEEMTDWASRLNLCQLLAITGCPVATREALYSYLVECFANRRPMIRAWAISVLAGFGSDERYRKPVKAMLREAHADSAGSIQARLRRLKLKNRPNQSSEPPPTAGTSAAEQPRVPAAVVAHL
jgi:hypothetical protein